MYSLVQESIQGKISKSTHSKATLVKKRLLEASDPQIDSNVIAFDKNKQRKVFSENFRIWAREASNIGEGKERLSLPIKVVYNKNPGNVLESNLLFGTADIVTKPGMPQLTR